MRSLCIFNLGTVYSVQHILQDHIFGIQISANLINDTGRL